MKETKRVEVYVESNLALNYIIDGHAIVEFPEKECMPKDAVKKIKKIVDNYLSLTECGTLFVKTYSTEVISFLYDYGKIKKYMLQLYYKNKKIGIESVFKKFNSVFRYIERVTTLSRQVTK